MSFVVCRHTVSKRAAVLTSKQFRHTMLVAGTTRDPERNQLILSLSHGLGMRVTELSRITVADVLHPKGRIRGELALRPSITKNNTGRTVPISSPTLIEHLERYLAYRIERRIGMPAKGTDYRGLSPDLPLLFSGRSGGFAQAVKRRRLDSGMDTDYRAADGLEALFRHLYQIAGIKGASSHSGRRTLATRLAADGVAIEDISRFLGHSSPDHTRSYLDVTMPAVRQAYAAALKGDDPDPIPAPEPRKTRYSKVVARELLSLKSLIISTVDQEKPDYSVPKMIAEALPIDSLINKSGVYFLINDENEVVYVGQSENLMARIGSHSSSRAMRSQFSRVAVLPVKKEQLLCTEGRFIQSLQPRLNKAGIIKPLVATYARPKGRMTLAERFRSR